MDRSRRAGYLGEGGAAVVVVVVGHDPIADAHPPVASHEAAVGPTSWHHRGVRTEPPADHHERGAGTITELVGVYHAEGTLVGELRYWIGARLGRAHCALCDITHGTFKEKDSWRTCAATLPVPFRTYHLDDRPDDVRAATEGATPAVLARTAVGVHPLLGPAELELLDGDPGRLAEAIVGSVRAAGLGWPAGDG